MAPPLLRALGISSWPRRRKFFLILALTLATTVAVVPCRGGMSVVMWVWVRQEREWVETDVDVTETHFIMRLPVTAQPCPFLPSRCRPPVTIDIAVTICSLVLMHDAEL
ncbi:hypothetical protein EGR_06579 [Echinococcus granulosus]|uniref:Uncharacterized protein n=1 Tax=Echinococcus granulosus TaxID=6210 RepID=W6UKG5_ECHGR|nr:hypothetical protein EGR_06579 [Echinococcus granulosus]EUB58592.1 hypothetical protein EGR_06579 [Echinococcus granulosus]